MSIDDTKADKEVERLAIAGCMSIEAAAALIRRMEKERDEAVETARAYLRRATLEAEAGRKTRNKALDEAAALVSPSRERPCDCDSCYCHNSDDAQSVAVWDANTSIAKAILALKSPAQEPTT